MRAGAGSAGSGGSDAPFLVKRSISKGVVLGAAVTLSAGDYCFYGLPGTAYVLVRRTSDYAATASDACNYPPPAPPPCPITGRDGEGGDGWEGGDGGDIGLYAAIGGGAAAGALALIVILVLVLRRRKGSKVAGGAPASANQFSV